MSNQKIMQEKTEKIESYKEKQGELILKRINVREFWKVNKKYRPLIKVFVAFLWIVSTISAYQAIRTSSVIEEKIVKNTIEEKIAFDYAAIVKPSTLYPQGGRVVPDNVIFTALTDSLIVKLDASINADKPVKIEGSTEVVYSLVAKDMWEREFQLIPAKPVNSEGVSHSLLQEEIQLDFQHLFNFIKIVEEETLVRLGNYKLIIKPRIVGNAYQDNDNKIYEINSAIEIPFELSNQYIKFAAESPEKEFVKTQTVEDVSTIPQTFTLLGQEMSVIKARYGLGAAAIILFILMLITTFERRLSNKQDKNEISLIDKKYKNKIISISDKAGFDNLPKLGLDSFKALLQIAEEKDEPVLRYEDEALGVVYYYIVGNTTIYYYRSAKTIIVEGSGLSHDA